MSIIIKGMEMPKSCVMCRLHKGARREMTCFDHSELDKVYLKSRPEWCPLVHVPDHGRLIDADALVQEISDNIDAYWNGGGGGYYIAEDAIGDVRNAPTIIPAEEDK